MPRLMALSLWSKFLALPGEDKALIGEAVAALALASVAIKLLQFRTVVKLAEVQVSGQPPSPEARVRLRERVQWTVEACARWLPWYTMCFQQGLAAQLILRRHGIDSVLHYGAAPDKKRGVVAHVWVCDGQTVVIGGDGAVGMGLLATFPATPTS